MKAGRATNVAVASISLALSLAVAECGLRVHRRYVAPSEELGAADPSLPELQGVLALAAPNTAGRYKGQVHRTNQHGFRGPEPALAKPDGVFRIAVIGDSVTMGEGVAEDDTYAARLGRALHDARGGRYEVLNLGLSGLNLRQSLEKRLPIGLRFDPDLIVYGFTINDLEKLPGYRTTRRAPPSPTRWELVKRARLAWIELADHFVLRGSYRSELEHNYRDNAAVWAAFERDLARLAGIARGRGICVALLIHTDILDFDELHPFEPYYRQVAEAAARRVDLVIPTLAAFRGRDPATLRLGRLDPHPNAEGHRLLAEALLQGLGSLPKTCWQRHAHSPAHAGSEQHPLATKP